MSSASVAWLTSRPRLMITTWSASCSTSGSTWLEYSTVRPDRAQSRSSPRSHAIPSGSRPFAGSSRISAAGSPSSAAASASRCRIPRGVADLANHFQLKHMANAETRLVRYNLLHPGQPRRAQFTVVPSAVFADPQVASVGATEQELRARAETTSPPPGPTATRPTAGH